MTLRRPDGQDDYDWWAKMTFDDIKRVRAIIEAAAYLYRVRQEVEDFDVEWAAVRELEKAVEAYEKEKG